MGAHFVGLLTRTHTKREKKEKMEGQFKETVHEMYIVDKQQLENLRSMVRAPRWPSGVIRASDILGDFDDPLESYYHERKDRINIPSIEEKRRMFNQFRRFTNPWRRLEHVSICYNIQLAFLESQCYCWLKESNVDPRSILIEQTKATFSPFSLQHIAAARSIPTLKYYKPNILIGVYNATKNQDLFTRVGHENERKNYKFANIVKNYIYDRTHGSLVTKQYFDNLKLCPTAFCAGCGIIRKIEENYCHCRHCELIKKVMVNTSAVEKPFHITYFKRHRRCYWLKYIN